MGKRYNKVCVSCRFASRVMTHCPHCEELLVHLWNRRVPSKNDDKAWQELRRHYWEKEQRTLADQAWRLQANLQAWREQSLREQREAIVHGDAILDLLTPEKK